MFLNFADFEPDVLIKTGSYKEKRVYSIVKSWIRANDMMWLTTPDPAEEMIVRADSLSVNQEHVQALLYALRILKHNIVFKKHKHKATNNVFR